MQKIKDNKKIMVVKAKDQYYIINKTEKRIILNNQQGSYLILRPHDKFTTNKEEALQYV